MNLFFSPNDLAFQADVRAFVDRHWQAGRYGHADSAAADRAWARALLDRGFQVPDWPAEHGGPGWTPLQRFIWHRELARAGVPVWDGTGAALPGLLLCSWGTEDQRARFLPGIRERQMRWCHASDLHVSFGATGPVARRAGSDYLVTGTQLVAGAGGADWLLCAASTHAERAVDEAVTWLLVDMCSPGIEVRSMSGGGESGNAGWVVLSDVRVPARNRVGGEHRARSYARRLEPWLHLARAPVMRARMQLAALRRVAQTMPQGDSTMAQDVDFLRHVRSLEIDLAGLEALEQRLLSALQGDETGEWQAAMLKVRCAELQRRIALLRIDVLGYEALPQPVPRKGENEAPVGYDAAAVMDAHWLDAGLLALAEAGAMVKSELVPFVLAGKSVRSDP